jgi:hypothetical protein
MNSGFALFLAFGIGVVAWRHTISECKPAGDDPAN